MLRRSFQPNTKMDSMDHSGHQHAEHDTHHMSTTTSSPSSPSIDHSSHQAASLHAMQFHFGCCETILFDFWTTSSALSMFVSCLLVFVLSCLYEMLKSYRTELQCRCKTNQMLWPANSSKNASSQLSASLDSRENCSRCFRYAFGKLHIAQTVLHVAQVLVAYILMLIFMTYNLWLCLSIILGAAVGYFVFAWKIRLVSDILLENNSIAKNSSPQITYTAATLDGETKIFNHAAAHNMQCQDCH